MEPEAYAENAELGWATTMTKTTARTQDSLLEWNTADRLFL
jgi:hypothetical protein